MAQFLNIAFLGLGIACLAIGLGFEIKFVYLAHKNSKHDAGEAGLSVFAPLLMIILGAAILGVKNNLVAFFTTFH